VQYVALGYGLYLLWSQQITFGTMALFLQLRGQLSKAFHQVVRLIPTFLETSVSAHRICELNDLPKEIHIEIPQQWETHAKEGFTIKMSDVSFAYLEEHQIFTKMNFCARPGEMVALIGMSGEGKTTLIRLLLGLIHPNCGEAVLQAMNGETIPVNTETRKWFSYVPQGNTVFSGTIAENLQLVKKDATEEEMQQALEIACAWDFVKEMPETIHTTVGEKGKGLSEGQAQRIAIARAILRDTPILLFDEATSALDVETEKRVLSNIVQHKSNKACVIITHRPSVTHLCQRVYCVKDTMIKEIEKEEAEHTLLHL
jgi:ABC-type multidrug transport system fused ATPase/permease subunit